MEGARLARLTKLFNNVLYGRDSVTPHNAPLFLESIYSHPDPVTCIHRLASSQSGKAAFQDSMRYTLTKAFFNGAATSVLQYLQNPALSDISGGDIIQTLVLKIADPPIFWSAFQTAYMDDDLDEGAQVAFAWLLHQLISLPHHSSASYRNNQTLTILAKLLSSSNQDLRTFGYKIKHVLDTDADTSNQALPSAGSPPGGRHDNDFANFHDISIVPTADEVNCREPAFLRPSEVLLDPSTEGSRISIHLDNQFRLLREDMIYELREELKVADSKRGRRRAGANKINNLRPRSMYFESGKRRSKVCIELECREDLPLFAGIKPTDRVNHVRDNRNFLRHQSLACLLLGEEIVAFVTINRNEDSLAEAKPVVIVQLEGKEGTLRALRKFKEADNFTLLQIDTALFAYEFVLKALQKARGFPLEEELLFWKPGCTPIECLSQVDRVVAALTADPSTDLRPLLATKDHIHLDLSQAKSLLSGLTQRVSLIQGPPGTGKSFLGALLAKAIHDYTEQTILVVCFTNHALDDILTSLLDVGIPDSDMVRLGGKSTTRTEHLSLQKQGATNHKFHQSDWSTIDEYKQRLQTLELQLRSGFLQHISSNPKYPEVLNHIEFEDPEFYDSFSVPQSTDGMQMVDRKGHAIQNDYLIDRWRKGGDAGVLANVRPMDDVWRMDVQARSKKYRQWIEDIQSEKVEALYATAETYNDFQERLNQAFSSRDVSILQSKRIIGCTTTAAAKYGHTLRAVAPQVVLVEEAGEILESHVLTALSKHTSQLILIGDHKQLRPKVNNYELTVEKGNGYDLNRSLFERLILAEYPHQTLTQQHRMRPEISDLIRQLTYPELEDAPRTQNRPDIRGLQDNIIFIDHTHPEDVHRQISERKGMASTSSKQNKFEVEMVMKIVRYLGQQGYGTDDLVILTPYLGQLHKLRDALKTDNDPVLNDLDSFELVRAGLLTPATAKAIKKPIRLATIDNYQGEESDIVIISLTRSNPDNDIGFMYSPERLNVLLSRARNGLIMIGNSNTFKNSRKGKELWSQLFGLLAGGNHLYSGLPVVCDRHPDRMNTLSKPDDFVRSCPEGGCDGDCDVVLNCKLHTCPSKCHNLSDHSKVKCTAMVEVKCPRGHDLARPCSDTTPPCQRCQRVDRLLLKKQQDDLKEKQRQEKDEADHLAELAAIQEDIEREKKKKQQAQQVEDRKNALAQKIVDLQTLRATQNFPLGSTSAPQEEPEKVKPPTSQSPSSIISKFSNLASSLYKSASPSTTPVDSTQGKVPVSSNLSPLNQKPPSASESEWLRQKSLEGAVNLHIDKIMGMVGLEAVKFQVLAIKAKIDASVRQDTSLAAERFNIVLLGNPGTGKTTVAREYARFLTSVGVIPGNVFNETTGSRLANDGVPGAEKAIQGILSAGGGAIFIDEAYQLTSKHNSQGVQVLDFLLAEMENNVGKIVFILAGYSKEMESFFDFNPGLNSRIPYKLKFEDYKDDELMDMLENLVTSTFKGRMKVEDGLRGLYGRIAIRRIGRRRSRKGFGNARELQTFFAYVRQRQAVRLTEERTQGLRPDDFLLTREDLIGPDPSVAIKKSPAWVKLQGLIGLKTVKESIRNLVDSIKENYERELSELLPLDFSLNRVFLGPPGTGKTTVAQLYGQILADLGLLSKGEVLLKNPSDFVGSVLGESEDKTKGILSNAVGKVLVIDEAYMLYGGGGSDAKNQGNQFKTSVIDTMVAEVQNVPGDDRCVLLLGYEKQMLDMFQNVNPGLARRFKIEEAFRFEDFDDEELLAILDKKLKEQDLGATSAAKAVAIELLSRARNRPNFGNGGEVENLLSKAKEQCLSRRSKIPFEQRPREIVFEPQDFDEDFDRGANATKNLAKLFEDIVGHTEIIAKLRDYQRIAAVCKSKNMDIRKQVPTNFVFTGPPGTGKTTIARKMGQVYYDMGLLASRETIECSASDLVGEYVGHTGPKTKALFEKALGKVLFIDEAYRLAGGHFAQEAVDELVGLLTHETFKGKLIVILAGYDEDMKTLMQSNTGLNSRFPEWVSFPNLHAKDCLDIVLKQLKKESVAIDEPLDDQSTVYLDIIETIENLASLPDWGNARDMVELAKVIVNRTLLQGADDSNPSSNSLSIGGKDILDCAKKMLQDRSIRSRVQPKRRPPPSNLPVMHSDPTPPTPPSVNTATSTRQSSPPLSPKPAPNPPPKKSRRRNTGNGAGPLPPASPSPAPSTSAAPVQLPQSNVGRDPGVSDEVWAELEDAKRAAAQREQEEKDAIAALMRKRAAQEKKERDAKRLAERLAREIAAAQEAAQRAELEKKQRDAARREKAAAEERARIAARLKAEQEAAEQRKREEQAVQTKLRSMGVCVAGYQWHRVGNGYQCGGGSHFVSASQLGM